MSGQRTSQSVGGVLDRRTVLVSGMGAIGATALAQRENLFAAESAADSDTKPTLKIVVMDPLAAPLACDCVKGYANRQYQRLAEWLDESLDTKSTVLFADSLAALKEKDSTLNCDLVIGKFSVVAISRKRSAKP